MIADTLLKNLKKVAKKHGLDGVKVLQSFQDSWETTPAEKKVMNEFSRSSILASPGILGEVFGINPNKIYNALAK